MNAALPTDEVLPAAMAFAERMAKGAPMAIRWTKYTMNKLINLAGIADTLIKRFDLMHAINERAVPESSAII